MRIQAFPNREFTVCKPLAWRPEWLEAEFCFVAKTDEELSLVCETTGTPNDAAVREDGWRMFRVAGVLEFSLTGIMAHLSGLLSARDISLFAVSTFNTDYIFVRSWDYESAVSAFTDGGNDIEVCV